MGKEMGNGRLPLALCLSTSLAGCFSGFTGREILVAPTDAPKVAETPAPVTVWFEEPMVIDEDEEKDFTPNIEVFTKALQTKQLALAAELNDFAEVTGEPREGAYKITTKAVISDYRAPVGGKPLLIASFFFPPILGFPIWGIRVVAGTCDGTLTWELYDPQGQLLTEFSEEMYFDQGRNDLLLYRDSQLGEFLASGRQAVIDAEAQAAAAPAQPQANPPPAPVTFPEPSAKALELAGVKVAVMPLGTKGTADPSIVEVIDDLLLSSLQRAFAGKMQLVSKTDIDTMLGFETVKDLMGCDDLMCTANIAGALGVDTIIAGKVGALGAKYVLSLTWINQKDATVINRYSQTLGTQVETFDVGADRAAVGLIAIPE